MTEIKIESINVRSGEWTSPKLLISMKGIKGTDFEALVSYEVVQMSGIELNRVSIINSYHNGKLLGFGFEENFSKELKEYFLSMNLYENIINKYESNLKTVLNVKSNEFEMGEQTKNRLETTIWKIDGSGEFFVKNSNVENLKMIIPVIMKNDCIEISENDGYLDFISEEKLELEDEEFNVKYNYSKLFNLYNFAENVIEKQNKRN